MDAYQEVKDRLDQLGINFDVVEHPPVLTTEQADSYIEGLEGVRTKSMFLTNKKKTQYYLLIMASTESLAEKMQLPAGTVSPFGLLNNEEKDILVYFDQDIVSEEIMTFHPNTNEKTIFIKTQDLFLFLESIDFTYEILILP